MPKGGEFWDFVKVRVSRNFLFCSNLWSLLCVSYTFYIKWLASYYVFLLILWYLVFLQFFYAMISNVLIYYSNTYVLIKCWTQESICSTQFYWFDKHSYIHFLIHNISCLISLISSHDHVMALVKILIWFVIIKKGC